MLRVCVACVCVCENLKTSKYLQTTKLELKDKAGHANGHDCSQMGPISECPDLSKESL